MGLQEAPKVVAELWMDFIERYESASRGLTGDVALAFMVNLDYVLLASM